MGVSAQSAACPFGTLSTQNAGVNVMADQQETQALVGLLREIRDTQAAMAAQQERVVELMQQQAEHTRARVAESIELQRVGIARQKQALLGALPLILLCLGLIGYLIWKYF